MAIPRAVPSGRTKMPSKKSFNKDVGAHWQHNFGYTGAAVADNAMAGYGKKKRRKVIKKLNTFYKEHMP